MDRLASIRRRFDGLRFAGLAPGESQELREANGAALGELALLVRGEQLPPLVQIASALPPPWNARRLPGRA